MVEELCVVEELRAALRLRIGGVVVEEVVNLVTVGIVEAAGRPAG